MYKKRSTLLKYYFCFIALLCTSAQSSASPEFEFSGFGRIVAGYLSTDNAELDNYENSISFDEQSLIAIQTDILFNEKFSASVQLLGHSSEDRDSGVEWAYLTYSPSDKLDIRIGRQRTLFYNYSDVIDVGFAYAWITPPRGVYSNVLFPQYEGLNIKYMDLVGDFLLSGELFWGAYNNDQTALGSSFSNNINDYRGFVFNLSTGPLSVRASYADANINVSVDDLEPLRDILIGVGFASSAELLQINDLGRFFQIDVKYEEFDWFIEIEANRLTSKAPLVADRNGLAITAGYHYHSFLFYSSFSSLNSDEPTITSGIPVGIDPQLDLLDFGFQATVDSVIFNSGETYTVGLRYDLNQNISLKTSITHVEGAINQDSFFINTDSSFNNRAQLYQLALEWVF